MLVGFVGDLAFFDALALDVGAMASARMPKVRQTLEMGFQGFACEAKGAGLASSRGSGSLRPNPASAMGIELHRIWPMPVTSRQI